VKSHRVDLAFLRPDGLHSIDLLRSAIAKGIGSAVATLLRALNGNPEDLDPPGRPIVHVDIIDDVPGIAIAIVSLPIRERNWREIAPEARFVACSCVRNEVADKLPAGVELGVFWPAAKVRKAMPEDTLRAALRLGGRNALVPLLWPDVRAERLP
jgi:hypothetical protein